MDKNPILEELHRIRLEVAAKHNYDLQSMFREFKEHERASGLKLLRRRPKRIKPDISARA